MPDQVQRRLYLTGQVDSFAVSVNMHKENPWLVPKEMVVQCGHFQSVVEQRRHDGIDLVF